MITDNSANFDALEKDLERELSIFRSGSVQPTVEGSRSAIRNLLEFDDLSRYYVNDSLNPSFTAVNSATGDGRKKGDGSESPTSLFSKLLGFGRGDDALIWLGGRRKSFALAIQPFTHYVEIGRVALVNYGKDYGRLVVIVDVIDQNRALVDAPDMVLGQMNFKRLSLTDIKMDIPRIPKKKSLIAAMEAANVKNKWENSSRGRQLIVQKRRAALNDFDRFKVMLAKIKGRCHQAGARQTQEAEFILGHYV